MYENRISYLEESHRVLDIKITEMIESGNFDDLTISEFKKKKLQLKDEISRLRKLEWEEQHERVEWDDER